MNIKLIDYDAFSKKFRKVPSEQYKIVELKDGHDGSYKIDLNENIFTRHGRLTSDSVSIGTGLYIYTENPELLDECRTWITEISEKDNGEVDIISKDYFVMRHIESIEGISKEDLKLLSKVMNGAPTVYTSSKGISQEETPYSLKGYLIPRENIELLLNASGRKLKALAKDDSIVPIDEAIEGMPFKNNISVFKQTNKAFTEISLSDALDVPRTVLKKNRPAKKSFFKEEPEETIHGAKRMNYYFEFDPTVVRPDILSDCPQVEFEKYDMSDDGLVIWKKTYKIVQNAHNAEYAEVCRAKGIIPYLELPPNMSDEALKELLPTGLLHEYEEVPKELLSGIKSYAKYYVERPLVKTEHKQFEI